MQIVTRDEYLLFRHVWKNEYQELSKQIRAFKVATQLTAKSGSFAESRLLQSMRAKDSNYARHLMERLEEMKETSRVSVAFTRFLEQRNHNFKDFPEFSDLDLYNDNQKV